jgi:hypothetical protein
MARGWESKSIESQQEEALDRAHRSPLPAPGDATSTERHTLLLARSKALSDLQHACAAPHRAMLEEAIADLDARLRALG